MIILRSRVSSCLGDLSESTRGTACQSPAGRDGKSEWMEVCCKRLVYYKMVPYSTSSNWSYNRLFFEEI